ncbi:hypothetical protein J2X97_002510 [Epilithonimonas hungarica]|uniref:hypothetical protein n=1 Tax=Epilithonimonas hungarica TaxID=454006 RepID=UPI00278B1C05|nr:hypothetical protein [Epilithonimonas hungarica]MDP9956851.1 hypothetical protein [Epilithonimonas hungarica]
MKKIFLSALLSISSFYFSQSVIQKYNSLYKRYEYFNSSGNMIGYKQYNNLSRQWEYFDLNDNQNEKQPRQYGDYTQPYNFDLIERGLRLKQNNYDSNFQTVKSTINYIINDINSWDSDSDTKHKIIQQFKSAISKNLDNQDINYASNDETNRVIGWLLDTLEAIIKKENSNNNDNPRSNDNNLSPQNNKKFIVTRITHYNSQGFVLEGMSDLKIPTYIIFNEKEIRYKTAKGIETYRNLTNKKYNSNRSGFEYTSNWGAIFVAKDFSSVIFYDKNDFSGDYYIYYIAK